MVIEKDRRTNKYVQVDRELTKDEKAQKRKVLYAMRKQAERDLQQYKEEHRHGFCPHCHMLIPMNGICDCGYVKGGN